MSSLDQTETTEAAYVRGWSDGWNAWANNFTSDGPSRERELREAYEGGYAEGYEWARLTE